MNNTEVFITARKCSYDPMQDLIDVTYDNDKHSAYLQVPHRLIWFATYCAENGLNAPLTIARRRAARSLRTSAGSRASTAVRSTMPLAMPPHTGAGFQRPCSTSPATCV